ncbi:probable G-protein coupled receptor 139 [Leucoraja erinacea]|uniref:probable G-protein coupled receptor 139 n=1 Tax=Leucoraja erinaceus TaxID=7782 RepID=UPI002456D61D|nr:probable G-protein coupled receptor 139 [Leucoraja erinacea]
MTKKVDEGSAVEVVYMDFSKELNQGPHADAAPQSKSGKMHAPGNGPIFATYYTILAVVGVPANVLTIAILSQGKCGLSKCITRYLVFMAVTDFLVIVTAVIFSRLRAIYFPVSILSTTPGCSLIIALSSAAKDASVWLTVAFTFDRCVAICCQQLKLRYCTEKTAAVVIGTVCFLACLRNVPFYFEFEPMYIIDTVPWFCSIKEIFYISVAWRVYEWSHRMLNPCVPFLLILMLNVLTVRYILAANRARGRLRAQNNGEKQRDPEMQSRRKSIILLFAISGCFILLWATDVANFLFVQISANNYVSASNSNDPKFIFQEGGYMLQFLSSCANTFIYAGTQTKFRQQLKTTIQYPFNIIRQRFK